MKLDLLRVGDVRRRGEIPFGSVARAQRRQLGPGAPQVVAAEEMRGLRAGEDPHALLAPGACETVDVLLAQPLIAALPGTALVDAREDRAVVDAGEYRAALRL